MTLILDAQALPPTDREEAIRSLIWDAVVRVEIAHHPDPPSIRAHGRISNAGRLNICSIRSNATTIQRTPRQAHNPIDPYVFLGLQLAGTSTVIQNGREAVLQPGDLAVYDTRRPYTLLNPGGIHQHFFRVPVSELELPGSVLGAVTAIRLDGQRPLARVAAGHLRQLAENVDQLTDQEAARVAEPSLALIRALLAAQTDGLAAREQLQRSLEPRVIAYVRAHLGEHDLSAARIAHEHHVSVRHLYRLLSEANITLERCRQDLADPHDASTITATAHRWGFADVTHFGRVFKAAYGVTPREWRTQCRTALPRDRD
jgi:AraC-like DNA-binding protein